MYLDKIKYVSSLTMKILLVYLSIWIEFGTACYWNTDCPYKYVSSKTAYNAVRGDMRDSIVKIQGCDPVSIWGMIRHGKRYPSVYFGKYMKDAIVVRDYVVSSYKKEKSSLCAQDVENLQDWNLDNKIFKEAYHLTDEGHKEMFDLGKRLKQAFPKLLSNLTDDAYSVRPAYGHWIEKSAASFVKGLSDNNIKIESSIFGYDFVAPYATCGKYVKEVRKNDRTYDEVNKYMKTSDYLEVKDRMERRTGILNSLTDENITALYDLCRYTWSDKGKSPWCALFTTKDLMVLEYIGDLKHYYRNGYGHPWNEKFGHIPLAELLKNFKLAKDGKGNTITAYVSHSTMLDMIYVALGLFHDEQPLTGAHRNLDRKWRTSKSSGFSVNFIAVLNKCTKNNADEYNVVFYLNEQPIRSLCNEGVCTWKEFEDNFSPFVNTTIDFCEFQVKPES